MSIIAAKEQIDAYIEAVQQIGGTFAAMHCHLPALRTDSLLDGRKVASLIKQVEIGHRTMTHACNGMHGLTANHYYPQIKNLTSVSWFGKPLLDMHTLAAERVDNLCYLLVGFQLANATCIVEPKIPS